MRTNAVNIRINLNLFAILITKDRTNKKRTKITAPFTQLKAALKCINYLLSKSLVYIKFPADTANDTSDISSIISYLPLYFYTGYISSKSKKVLSRVIPHKLQNTNLPAEIKWEISLRIPLYNLIISTFLYTYYLLRNKIKRIV